MRRGKGVNDVKSGRDYDRHDMHCCMAADPMIVATGHYGHDLLREIVIPLIVNTRYTSLITEVGVGDSG